MIDNNNNINEDEFFDQEGNPELEDLDSMIETSENTIVPSDYTQHMLLSYLISSDALWVKCRPIIKEEYFENEYRPVVRYIVEHFEKYKTLPNDVMIHAKVGVKLNLMDDYGKREQWLCDTLEEFCRTEAYLAHLLKAAESIQHNKSRGSVLALQQEAAVIANISLHLNLGNEAHDDVGEILSEARQDDEITTGYPFLDTAFGGGVTRPSFNIVSAASGDGKSIFLQNAILNRIEQGDNCIYYTLELQTAMVIKRYAAMMTSHDISKIYNELDTVIYMMKSRKTTDGQLWIVKFPMVGTTIADIASHLLELKSQTRVTFNSVGIDYLDVMDPMRAIENANIHLRDKFIAEEVNDWAHENNLIVWSASQQIKGAQDEKVARQSGVAGGAPKINTCDNLIIGKRSAEDEEDERWWGHIQKARSSRGKNCKIPFRFDAKTLRMSNVDQELFEEANPALFKTQIDSYKPITKETDPLLREANINSSAIDDDTITEKDKRVISTMDRFKKFQSQGIPDAN